MIDVYNMQPITTKADIWVNYLNLIYSNILERVQIIVEQN